MTIQSIDSKVPASVETAQSLTNGHGGEHTEPKPEVVHKVVNSIAAPTASITEERQKYYVPSVPLVDRFIDEPRPLRVAVIGGGIAGIVSGILLPKKVPGIKLTIYEKNSDFVSCPLNYAYGTGISYVTREERGLKTCIPESDATYHRTSINQLLRPTRTGLINSLMGQKFAIIGSGQPKSTVSTSTPSSTTRSRAYPGMQTKAPGP